MHMDTAGRGYGVKSFGIPASPMGLAEANLSALPAFKRHFR